jgi:Stage II sporulation protein E (SpoIIE)
MPLGLMPGMIYEEKETVLNVGEAALEAHDPQGEMFGFPRLQALGAEHGEERSLGDLLMEKLYSFVGEGWEQEDDITFLTLRRSPTGRRTSVSTSSARCLPYPPLEAHLSRIITQHSVEADLSLFCIFGLVSRYESRTTKSPELIFSALVGDDGARNVRFERAFCT